MKPISVLYNQIGNYMNDNVNINPEIRDIFVIHLYWGELEQLKKIIKRDIVDNKLKS